MPKTIKKNTSSVKPRKKVTELTCASCGEVKKTSMYYVSYNPIHLTSRIPYCKSCLSKMIADEKGNVSLGKVKETLRLIDRPFLYSLWKSSLEDKTDSWGCYIKNLQMVQYRKLGWEDSKFLPEIENDLNYEDVKQSVIQDENFEVTKEMLARWGKHTSEDYIKLEQFYWDMKDKNKIETPQEETYLKKLALISMKMDIELENSRYDEAKKLGDLFSKYMADSQFRTIDKTDADKTGGLRSFSQIYSEIEKDNFIPPWEHYREIKNVSQDIVDKTIMYMSNFILKLNKVESMSEPPSNTPKLNEGDV